MRMKFIWGLAVLFLFASIPAQAQIAGIVQVNVQTFAPGVNTVTGMPTSDNLYLVNSFLCNQVAPVVPVTVINPLRFFFDDPASTTVPKRVCIATIVSTLLPSLPNLPGYVITVTQTDSIGQTSPRSAASNPFAIQGIPSAPTGLKVL